MMQAKGLIINKFVEKYFNVFAKAVFISPYGEVNFSQNKTKLLNVNSSVLGSVNASEIELKFTDNQQIIH